MSDDMWEHNLPWTNASKECENAGSNLASIHSEEEMAAIQQAIQGKSLNVWIGLQDNSKLFGPYVYYNIFF